MAEITQAIVAQLEIVLHLKNLIHLADQVPVQVLLLEQVVRELPLKVLKSEFLQNSPVLRQQAQIIPPLILILHYLFR